MLIQTQTPSLKHLTTAHLATTMTLMSLNAQELRQKIENTLASNPALELGEEQRCPVCHRATAEPGLCPLCRHASEGNSDDLIVFVSPREDFSPPPRIEAEDDLPGDEIAPDGEDLPTYVLRQIAPDLAPEDRPLAAHLLTSLDEDGLLRLPLIEFARYHHVPLARVEAVLRLIQHADPPGVGASSPQEALLVQLEILSETQDVPPLAAEAIRCGMSALSRHQYAELARLLKTSTHQARQIATFISENLNPYPARSHWGSVRQPSRFPQDVYRLPDIVISRYNDSPDSPLVVEVISPLAGKLRINPLFRQAQSMAPPDKVEEWQEALEQATLLIKCLQQRNHTLVRLMQRLVTLQRQYILHGDAYLAPITRASLAEELGVHESTISRAVSGKALQLPNGRIVPLAKLFDRSLHIRSEIRQIVAQESQPLTDTQIAIMLKKKGYQVARRTVAKYRAMEGILPAHLRQSPRP